ncbi:MAG: homogentisate 1,2-dioxygenase [Candidatus Binatia bacterium]
MKSEVPLAIIEGVTSKQAHADLPEGTFEREISKDGFSGPSAQFSHRHPPTGWVSWEGPLRPRAFDLNRLPAEAASPWDAAEVLHNAHVRLRFWRTRGAMDHLVRNADGDELLFIHSGEGALYCDWGHLEFRDGDFVLLPRGALWRMECRGDATILLIEATNASYHWPERGLVGRQAIFDPAILDRPRIDDAFRRQQADVPWRAVIKRGATRSTVTFPFNPLDAVGWHGDLTPVRLNWRDIRPLMSHRMHLPPSAHSVFLSDRFMVSAFCPRPLETDPGALRLPFFHNNDDYDEVIFYHRGQFLSRDNIASGWLTVHPGGATHGPQPKAFAAGVAHARKETDEVAVMIDARDAIDIHALPEGVEWTGYVDSWKG